MLNQQDPLASAHARMQDMDKDELIKLVLIAANRAGIAAHGDSHDPAEATGTFLKGIDMVFSAYDTANFNHQYGNKITWGVHHVAEC